MIRVLPLLAVMLLAACGQAGGLYMPDQAPKRQNPLKKVSQPAASAPATSPNQVPAPAPAQPASPAPATAN
jgi:predicted small lipoprotein YifL